MSAFAKFMTRASAMNLEDPVAFSEALEALAQQAPPTNPRMPKAVATPTKSPTMQAPETEAPAMLETKGQGAQGSDGPQSS